MDAVGGEVTKENMYQLPFWWTVMPNRILSLEENLEYLVLHHKLTQFICYFFSWVLLSSFFAAFQTKVPIYKEDRALLYFGISGRRGIKESLIKKNVHLILPIKKKERKKNILEDVIRHQLCGQAAWNPYTWVHQATIIQ